MALNPALAEPELRLITVEGEASSLVSPDKATVRFSVVSTAKDAAKARKANAKSAESSLKAVRKLKIPEQKIHLESFTIHEDYKYNQAKRENELLGYKARRSFRVELETVDFSADTSLSELLAELIAEIFESGSNELDGVEFGLVNSTEHKNKVLKEAVANAKSKATEMLQALDAELGAVQKLSESSSYQPVRRFASLSKSLAMAAEASPEAYSEGDLEIKANVSAQFLIE